MWQLTTEVVLVLNFGLSVILTTLVGQRPLFSVRERIGAERPSPSVGYEPVSGIPVKETRKMVCRGRSLIPCWEPGNW